MPFVVKEGDILGYRINSEYQDLLETDDFSTDDDIMAAERLKNLKLLQASNNYSGGDLKEK